jgi:hypothetical protein
MGASPSNTSVSDITKSISTNILNLLQEAQNKTVVKQDVYGSCDTSIIQLQSREYTDCILDNIDNISDNFTYDGLLDTCSVYTSLCKMNNVDLNSNLNVTIKLKSDATIQSAVKKSIEDSLTQYGGTATSKYIKNITNTTDTITNNIVQNINNATNVTQTVKLKNTSGNYISIKSSLKIINDVLQKEKIYKENITSIINIISQTSKQKASWYTDFLIVAVILVIIGIIISITMTLKRSSDIGDFFMRMLPTIIWVVLSAMIIIIHYLAKPDYISYFKNEPVDPSKTDKDNKEINKEKFFYFMFGYITVLYILIIIIRRLINKIVY